MALQFEIYDNKSGGVASEEMTNLVIKRSPSAPTALTVAVKVSYNNRQLHNSLQLYDSDGKITIYTPDIAKGLNIKYPLPMGYDMAEHHPIDNLTITLIDELGGRQIVDYEIIIGGRDANDSFYSWACGNWLTWQPQIIKTTQDQPQFLSVAKFDDGLTLGVSSTLYLCGGATRELNLATIDYGRYNLKTDFESLWGELCRAENLCPVAYDVYGDYDLDIYRQRYLITNALLNEQYFIFQNSLGGFDTIVATGVQTLSAKGDVESFVANGHQSEINNLYATTIEQDTGFIQDEVTARQWREFMASNNRAVYRDGALVEIVVSDFEVKQKQGTLGSYTFKYHLSTPNERAFYQRKKLAPCRGNHHYYNYG